jgi:hypothetical protein
MALMVEARLHEMRLAKHVFQLGERPPLPDFTLADEILTTLSNSWLLKICSTRS